MSTVKFLFWTLLRLVLKPVLIQGASSMEHVMVKIGWHFFYQDFLNQIHVSFDSKWLFLPTTAAPQRPTCTTRKSMVYILFLLYSQLGAISWCISSFYCRLEHNFVVHFT